MRFVRDYLTAWSGVLGKLVVAQLARKFPAFMETEGTVSSS
jgi:hypothetical protein